MPIEFPGPVNHRQGRYMCMRQLCYWVVKRLRDDVIEAIDGVAAALSIIT